MNYLVHLVPLPLKTKHNPHKYLWEEEVDGENFHNFLPKIRSFVFCGVKYPGVAVYVCKGCSPDMFL